jgi:hypothetical protein
VLLLVLVLPLLEVVLPEVLAPELLEVVVPLPVLELLLAPPDPLEVA